ncbi:hypothetical protein CALVIDRAFT_512091 [Calocera viscosa TUFC12733]|uniref:Alpha-ketoglutarate-dependent dioxygenase AlkB-like domain-containing protein n=1 Tax=Calocera viscosa (strain TUFC12733) TaxID=1330018 RepID=A0A167PCS9_CALVF|nr:hypothetical protein CALVIDRAFT_512091 [Calocera viscosa TUFC12733]
MWASLRSRQCAAPVLRRSTHNALLSRGAWRLYSVDTTKQARYDLHCSIASSPFEILSWPTPFTGESRPETDRGKDDFTLVPAFLSLSEQRVLLKASLEQLDKVHGVHPRLRKRRKQVAEERRFNTEFDKMYDGLWDIFLPEDCYSWEEGHFDSVIHHFREAPVTSFPSEEATLCGILDRLVSLTPYKREHLIMHALHLSERGYIEGHVDNLEASGNMIMGVSLGAERILKMTGVDEEKGRCFQCLLRSGDVYITKGVMRYGYKHEILQTGVFKGEPVEGGQRLSLMFRDVHGAPLKDRSEEGNTGMDINK